MLSETTCEDILKSTLGGYPLVVFWFCIVLNRLYSSQYLRACEHKMFDKMFLHVWRYFDD